MLFYWRAKRNEMFLSCHTFWRRTFFNKTIGKIGKKVILFVIFLLVIAVSCWAEMPAIGRNDWIIVSGQIDEGKAEEIITALINLDSQPETAPIGIRISSSGGSSMAVMAVCDVIKNLRRPVVTVALGKAISGAALILSSGDQRYIGEHTIVMLHQPNIVLENWSSSFDDFRQLGKVLTKIEDQMYHLLAENTKNPQHEIKEMMKTEVWFTAKEAIEFGLADELLSKGGLRIKQESITAEEKKDKNAGE